MADFVKKDWKCGDTITADDLNRLENGVEEALDGGSVDCGYSCSEGWVTLTDESVTTVNKDGFADGALSYDSLISAPTIKVTFNGAEYTVNRDEMDGHYYYGEVGESIPSFVNYPFFIESFEDAGSVFNYLLTASAGTYQVKIEEFSLSATTTPCFNKAVHSVIDADIELLQPMIVRNTSMLVGGGAIDAQFADIYDAFYSGRRVVVVKSADNSAFEIVSVAKNANGGGTVIGGDGHTYAASTDGAHPAYSEGSGGGQN